MLAITGGRGRGNRGFLMAHGAAAGPEGSLPLLLAAVGMETNYVQACLIRAAGTGDKHFVANNHWAGKPLAG